MFCHLLSVGGTFYSNLKQPPIKCSISLWLPPDSCEHDIYMKNNFDEQEPILCVPPSKIDIFLNQYHTSLLGGHSGITKCYQTLKQRIYCPNLPYYVRLYIISCHICQLFKGSKKFDRPLMRRIYDINTPTLTDISMDIKHMPASKSPYKYILVLLCNISNFLVATPMKKATAEEVCSILFDNFMAYYAVPMRIIYYQDPAFMSSLCQWFFKAYGIQLVTVSPTNHKSLQAEHGIKSLSNILMKHLSGLGDNWHLYVRPLMLTYNTYNAPTLDNLDPFELALGRKHTSYPLQGPFSCNCANVLISSRVVHKYIYILRLWGMLRECTLGSSRVLRFYQHKIYNYNTCSCCTS